MNQFTTSSVIYLSFDFRQNLIQLYYFCIVLTPTLVNPL